MSISKKLIVGSLILLGTSAILYFAPQKAGMALGASVFNSQQLAPSASNGYILSTDGTNNSWIVNTGGGSSFPFTPFTSYNGTSTPIGFSAGLFTNGSTTISSIGTGFVQSINGLLSSASLTSGQVITALGFTPSPFPFTPTTNYGALTNATGTPAWFQNGLQASSTSNFTYSSTTALTATTLFTNLLVANTSAGTVVQSANGTPVSIMGVGNTANALFYGGVNIDGATRLSTSLTGLLKATAGAVTTATAGTDYENPLTFSAPLIRTSDNVAWTGLSTTSQPSSSNVLVSNGGAGVYGVSTTSVSCSGNTTCTSFTAIGSSPITISSTGGGTGLSTSSPTANDQVLVYNSAGTGSAYSIGTTSLTVSGPFTIASPIGVLKNGAITYTGLATTSALTQGQLLYNTTGGNGVASVATSTPTVTAPITYSGTLGAFVGGVAGAFDCTSASLSVKGCLTSADYTQFNNKIGSTSLSGASVISYTSGTGVITTTGGTFGAGNYVFPTDLTITGNSTTSIGAFTTRASTTQLYISGISSCSGSNALTTNSSGLVACGAISGSGGAYPFTPSTDGGINTSATSTPIQGTNPGLGLDVSNTSWYGIGGRLLAYASSTNRSTVFGIGSGGQGATTSASGQDNTTMGYLAGNALDGTGLRNTAIGEEALLVGTTTDDNTAIGYNALWKGLGHFNTVIGSNAMGGSAGFIASRNVAIGASAMNANATGESNVAVGYFALNTYRNASSTIAIGYRTAELGTGTTTGSIYIGERAGRSVTNNADYNVLLGYRAGAAATTMYGSIMIGGEPVTTGQALTGGNNLGIGYNTIFPSVSASNQLNIGGLIFGTLPATTTSTTLPLPTSGSLGIGSTSPFAKFSIHTNNGDTAQTLFAIGSSTASATTTLFIVQNTGKTGIGSSTPYGLLSLNAPAGTDPYFVVGSTSGEVAKITAAATPQFGLGTSTPYGSLTVEQGAETASVWVGNQGSTSPSFMVGGVNQNGAVGIGTTTTGSSTPLVVGAAITSAVAAFGNTVGMCYINPGNGISCTSDARMKKNITDMKEGLKTILGLRPVFYNWKAEDDSHTKHPGFIAQEVQKLAPDLIYTDPNGLLTMDYARVTPFLVSAIQEQQKEIEGMKQTAQENWQWVCIGLLTIWNLWLTVRRKRV